MMRYVLALDFGASAGRAMLAGFDGSRITLQEVHRFANEPVSKDGRLYWNVPQLMEELEQGLQAGYAIAPYESIAIDTWGVDYGMLGADGTLLELPRHYRDGRTDGILQKAEQLLPAAELYRRTGTQVMEINTLFQLLCQRDSGGFDQCATILPMPDLFAYLLTGTISAERSIASTTQMLSAETGTWDRELLELFHIPHRILPEIVESGTAKGTLGPQPSHVRTAPRRRGSRTRAGAPQPAPTPGGRPRARSRYRRSAGRARRAASSVCHGCNPAWAAGRGY